MDAAGFEAFYAATAPSVARQVALMLGEEETARQSVRLAYARAWRRWRSVSRLPDPQAWVRSTACRIGRSRKRRLTLALPHRTPRLPDEALVFASRDAAVTEALRRLPALQRDVLVLRYVVELDWPAAAAELGVEPAQVEAAELAGRAAVVPLLPHLFPEPEIAATEHAAPDTATDEVDPTGEALGRYLRETAERRHPALLPAAHVRTRRWRRRYVTAGASALMLTGLVAAGALGARSLIGDWDSVAGPGSAAGGDRPADVTGTPPATPGGTTGTGTPPADASTPPTDPSTPPASTPDPTDVPVPVPSGEVTAGPSAIRATDIPPNRRDLGFISGLASAQGATMLQFDRALLRANGTLENQNKLVRALPLAPDVTVYGGRRLPPRLTLTELLGLIDAGAVGQVPFVLQYDGNDQVGQIRELLQG